MPCKHGFDNCGLCHDKSGELIDARELFQPDGVKYQVQIEVKITARFLWSVAKCLWQQKDLRITHIFTNDPLLGSKS